MKRGKDDEKIVEPLFPRLHVNDADKGGPRAPPRNKMALYEQLSIPSQRFNRHGLLPLSAKNTSSYVPPGTSSQACGMERNLCFQHQASSPAPVHAAEKLVAQKRNVANVRSMPRYDQRKVVGEEDDFMVPVFVNSERAQSHVRIKNGGDKEKFPPVIPISSHRSVEIQEVHGRDSKQNGSLSAYSRQEVRDASKDDPIRDVLLNSLDLSAREEVDAEKSALKFDRLNDSDACLRQESRNRIDQDGGEAGVKDTDIVVDSQSRSRSHSGEGYGEVDKDVEYCRSRTCVPPQQRTGEVSDGVSETSMVDSISSTDIAPDDVVGLIGQQRFWKARRAIANQQRLFAVQVFELHRLIKVQRLIAASPNLLLDDSAFLGKSSTKTSPIKKILPPELVVKPLPRAVMYKDDSEKANLHKMECSAENAVGRTNFSCGKNNNVHRSANAPPPPAPTDAHAQMDAGGAGSWCFPPQPSAGNHQWLVPVMSPSEGLIYKPYPGPGLVGSVYGGYYGQFMTTPIPAGNFVGGPAYGVPAPPLPYHQGVGFPAPGLSYFPPYGVPAMNPNFSSPQPNEQMNQFGYTGNIPRTATTAQQQSSCNFPNAKNGNAAAAQPPPPSTKVNRDSVQVIQGSTGSSPGERGGAQLGSEGALTHFPTIPAADNGRLESAATRTTVAAATVTTPSRTAFSAVGVAATATAPRVIRVVPHNRTVASESAARIFQSIQEERNQY